MNFYLRVSHRKVTAREWEHTILHIIVRVCSKSECGGADECGNSETRFGGTHQSRRKRKINAFGLLLCAWLVRTWSWQQNHMTLSLYHRITITIIMKSRALHIQFSGGNVYVRFGCWRLHPSTAVNASRYKHSTIIIEQDKSSSKRKKLKRNGRTSKKEEKKRPAKVSQCIARSTHDTHNLTDWSANYKL